MEFQYEACKSCPINETCILAKSDHAWQCSMNKEFAPKIEAKTAIYVLNVANPNNILKNENDSDDE